MDYSKKLSRLIRLHDTPSPFYSPNGKQRDYIRRNNILPLYWRHLSEGDGRELKALLNEDVAPQADPAEIEARLAIASILTTGRKLEALFQLRVFPSHQCLKASGRCFGLVVTNSRTKWVLPFGTPRRAALRRKGQSETQLYAENPGSFEAFNWRAGEWVRRYWQMKNVLLHQSGTPLLFEDPEVLTPKIAKLLRSRRSRYFTEPRHAARTLEALERFLCASMTHEPGGDLASAARVTDNTSHISDTAMNYGKTAIGDPHGDDVTEKRQRLSVIGGIQVKGRSIGSAHTPATTDLMSIIEYLLGQLENSPPGSEQFHRSLTQYTTFLVSFGLAHRGEKNQALPSLSAIDPDTGFLSIHDTVRTDKRSHSRMVWVPWVIRDQIRVYESHLRTSLDRFPAKLAAYVTGALDRGELPLFDIRGNDWRRWTTKDVYNTLPIRRRRAAALKLNAGRHWLRSRMLGRCSEETINAFLGHWYLGREPWSFGSTLDPYRYRAELERTLPQLLLDLGFKAVTSNDN